MQMKRKSMKHLIALMLVAQAASATVPRLRTGREMIAGLQASTGVPGNGESLLFFQERSSSLPQTGAFSELSPASVGIALSLTALFCDQMVETDARQPNSSARWAHAMVDFNAAPSMALSPAVQDDIIATYADLFWMRSPDAEEERILRGMGAQLVSESTNDPADTKKILGLMCATVGASLPALVAQ
jgi:hypothetical protein